MKILAKKDTTYFSLLNICFVTMLACLLFVFFDTIPHLLKAWSADEYSHGYLAAPLACLMAWHRLAGKKIETKSSFWGVGWIAASLALLVISELSTFRQLSYYAIVFSVVGLVLVTYGKTIAKKIIPTFIFLSLGMPLPTMLYASLALHMKLISSTLGVAVLHILGYTVFQDGNLIDLGLYKLQVADACSGLRYLFPITSFAFLIAYLLNDKWWKKCVVFLSAIPIAIIMNSLRIAVVGIAVNKWGIKAADDFIHLFEGYVVFFLCVLLLIGEAIILQRIKPAGSFSWDFFSIPSEPLQIRTKLKRTSICASLLLFLSVAVINVAGIFEYDKLNIPPSPHLTQFPASLGAWTGTQETLESYALKELDLSDYWYATYEHADQNLPVNLLITYYDHQKIGTSAHSPSTCLPGGGWEIDRTEDIIWTPQQTALEPLRAKKILAVSGDKKMLVYYWFFGRGRIITSQLAAKWYLMIDHIMMKRSDGASIRIIAHMGRDETEEEAQIRIENFLSTFYGSLHQAIPK